MKNPPLIPDLTADDVDFVIFDRPGGPEFIAAWCSSELSKETINIARYRELKASTPDQPVGWHGEMQPFGDEAFRPRMTRVGKDGILAGIVPLRGKLVAACIWLDENGGVGNVLIAPSEKSQMVVEVDVCPWQGDGILAWECSTEDDVSLHVGRISRAGVAEMATFGERLATRRTPALAGRGDHVWLAWVEEVEDEPNWNRIGRVKVGRIDEDGFIGDIIDVDTTPVHQDVPSITVREDGCAIVVWQSAAVVVPDDERFGDRAGSIGQDAVNWLKAARVTPDGEVHPLEMPMRPSMTREVADEDQGWEFATVVAEANTDFMIAGRSAHGFFAAAGKDDTVGPRLPISESGWGGRGRRGRLRATTGGDTFYGRTERDDGVTIQKLALPRFPGPVQRKLEPHELEGVLFGTPSDPPGDTLYGDLHQHSILSDGLNAPEEIFLRALNRGHDFVALTDHEEFCQRTMGPMTWRSLSPLFERYNQRGEFVVLPAYEFTGGRPPGPGHKCIYFTARLPERLPDRHILRMQAMLRISNAFAVPHHLGFTGADIDHHDPKLQPVFEICSVHGIYEAENVSERFPPRDDHLIEGQWAKHWLDEGYRFGFVGGSDSHGLLWHHGVSSKRNPWDAGLTGVVGADRTRESVLAAIRDRRCFATTGARIKLSVSTGDHLMGSELAETEGQIDVLVEGTNELASVELVQRNAIRALSVSGTSHEESLAMGTDDWDYAYVRVTQTDGEMAWSSPIWFGIEPRAGDS